MITHDALVSTKGTPERSAPASHSFDIGAFDLVRRFVEHLVVTNASGEGGNGVVRPTRSTGRPSRHRSRTLAPSSTPSDGSSSSPIN